MATITDNPIFTTHRFLVRHLVFSDLSGFHEMQRNPNVMRYATGKASSLEENKKDLADVIAKYEQPDNQFWVWAIERQLDQVFVGTCALIGDGKGTYEIGFRFLEKYWGQGYGKEIANALIDFADDEKQVQSIIAYVDNRNTGSVKILERSRLVFIKEMKGEELNSIDRFYKLPNT